MPKLQDGNDFIHPATAGKISHAKKLYSRQKGGWEYEHRKRSRRHWLVIFCLGTNRIYRWRLGIRWDVASRPKSVTRLCSLFCNHFLLSRLHIFNAVQSHRRNHSPASQTGCQKLTWLDIVSGMAKQKSVQKKKRTKQPPLNWNGIKFEDAVRALLHTPPLRSKKTNKA
jgi:hypothetical protein